MTFYDYMIKKHLKGHGKRHDLAEDMDSDRDEFPRNVKWEKGGNGRKVLRAYLESCDACDSCLEVFELCWKEYARCEREKLKKDLSVQ